MILPWAVFAAAIAPAYVWLTSAHDAFVFIAVNTALAFCSTVPSGAVYAAIAESLPKASRAKTFALVYALPVTFLGGSTQFVITWLLKVTGEPMAVAWYMLGAALLALAGMVLVRESAPSRLRASPA